jgi:broad specificity phosphatase PhoE
MFNGAEPIRDIYNRLLKFHDEIMTSVDDKIILVGHGISLGFFNAIWLGR